MGATGVQGNRVTVPSSSKGVGLRKLNRMPRGSLAVRGVECGGNVPMRKA